MRLNTNIRKYVPLILAAGCLSLCGACERGGSELTSAILGDEEVFFVEQYLRLVEARQLAVSQDSLAAGRFALLGTSIQADSLRGIAQRISEDNPERWAVIFEEIVRRKKIMEAERR